MTDTAYKILIVDDDEFLVGMYALKLSQAGHLVQSARSAQEALLKLQDDSYTPDAVMFDLVMPHMDGFEFLERVREQNLAPDAAFIVLSNQSEPEDIEKGKSLGAAGHIVKANTIPSGVLTMVEKIVGNYRDTEEGSTHS